MAMNDSLDVAQLVAAARELARAISERLDDASASAITLSRDEAVLAQGLVEGVAKEMAKEMAAAKAATTATAGSLPLPPGHELLSLYHYLGSYRAVAARYGVPWPVIRTRITRYVQTLRT